MARRPIRILTFSSLFPNPAQPLHGLFVAERLQHLLATGEVEADIVAPVPWFPSADRLFGRYATYARAPRESQWKGRRVLHPRYAVVPGPGWYLTPISMAMGVRAAVDRLRRQGGGFDLIDAHYFYPDGVAAALLGRRMGVAVVITARGSDITLIPDYILARRWILWAAKRSAAIVAVSDALAAAMAAIGIDQSKIKVLRNGVDLDRFRPLDRDAARLQVGMGGRVLLSVGNLVELKGHDLVIEALRALPGWSLLIVGDGPLRGALSQQARTAGCADRVRFAGAIPQDELVQHYSAADILVLASSREGMANVLLEAAACGTPAIATRAEGSAEVVLDPMTGRLLPERSAQAIAAAVQDLEARPPDRAQIRECARRLSWGPTIRGLLDLFERIGRPGPG